MCKSIALTVDITVDFVVDLIPVQFVNGSLLCLA